MLNEIVNAAEMGWNPLLFTSEMPAADIQLLLIAIHSANPKFNGLGKPLSAVRTRAGALQPAEEKFFKEVKDDLLTNPQHGLIRVVDSGEFTTFGSIQQRTIREDSEKEVDELWIDYLTRLPVDAKYRGMPLVEARNETIRDAKRFAMSFKQGLGLPVSTPFQVNREGYKKARDNEGKMDATALAQYNAAEQEADAITYIFYDAEEKLSNEPKVGIIKARWNAGAAEPVHVYMDPDSRRIFDMTAGMGPQTGHSPTGVGAKGSEEVVL